MGRYNKKFRIRDWKGYINNRRKEEPAPKADTIKVGIKYTGKIAGFGSQGTPFVDQNGIMVFISGCEEYRIGSEIAYRVKSVGKDKSFAVYLSPDL